MSEAWQPRFAVIHRHAVGPLKRCAAVTAIQHVREHLGRRIVLLQLAAEQAYAPLWGRGFLVELDYVLERLEAKRGREDSRGRRRHLFEQMRHAFPGAEINGAKDGDYDYDWMIRTTGTSCTRRSWARQMRSSPMTTGLGSLVHGVHEAALDAVNPAKFATNTVSAHPEAAVRAWVAMAARMTAPPHTHERCSRKPSRRNRPAGSAKPAGADRPQ
jgi:hypothetical protein